MSGERASAGRKSPLSIAVIGAGFAGLRCADVLLQRGCEVTIFEARNRVGGRVAQSEHLGHMVDLGPNWAHGAQDNPILKICKQKGIPLLPTFGEEQAVIDTAGEAIDPCEAAQYTACLWDDGAVADAFRHSREHASSIDPTRSLYDFFAEKAESMFTDEPDEVASRKRETFLLTTSVWGSYAGCPVTEQSLKFFFLEETIEGGNAFVAGTYDQILKEVSRHALRSARIRLDCKVTEIDFSSWNQSDLRQSGLKVTAADGMTSRFDDVVVTCPLGWLKRNQSAFRPALPSRLSEAIENIGYGTLDKVYFTFPSAFWEAQSSQHCVPANRSIANDESYESKHKMPQEYESHEPDFFHWLSPEYATDTNPERWDQQGMNLAALPSHCAHPTILFYIYGPCSKHFASIVATANKTAESDAKLIDFFTPYFSRLPNYDSSRLECMPKAVLATAWANDEFAGYGSYSNFPVGLDQGDKDINVMRHGLPEQHLWFAGEHTAPFADMGTTCGAYLSGECVAERILTRYGLNS